MQCVIYPPLPILYSNYCFNSCRPLGCGRGSLTARLFTSQGIWSMALWATTASQLLPGSP